MQTGLDAMEVALRVLTAITQNRNPEPSDVESLRRFEGGTTAKDVDELACEVIQEAVKRREKLRAVER